MSKVNDELKHTALDELMVVIKRNTQHSACIDNFECLLREIDNPVFVNSVITGMFKYITEAFELFRAVNLVSQKKFKAKMLTPEFLEPDRFFYKTKCMADSEMRVRAALEMYLKKKSDYTRDTNKELVYLDIQTAEQILNQKYKFDKYRTWEDINKNGFSDDIDINEELELARKMMLLYNYIPAITKAILQTKRRSLMMDNNSKKFE